MKGVITMMQITLECIFSAHSTLSSSFAFFPSRPLLPTTTTEAEGEAFGNKPGSIGSAHTPFASLGRSKPYPHLGATPTKNTEATGVARDL